MVTLVIGLFIFLGIHSLRIISDAGRRAAIRRIGEMRFKGAYSVLSLVGLLLLVWGYGWARAGQGVVYDPIAGARHLALLLVPVGFVLVAAAYAPTGHIKKAVRHPMVLGVALWALGHLLANGGTADVVLFGAFLVWAVLDYLNSLGRTAPVLAETPRATGDVAALAAGLVASAIFLGGLHAWLFGVSPLA
ncbi:NnrU family protein [Jiella sonneratiae]|uniref:NnrU family protein n=1 Tax=Jiella sonneratiae TaxID=2816856 RepID=A0ABS3IXM3_9HYPH|nr:NnrU family protein [Jiella sonneratiae]MBO0902150.1 NnrU family protein [Jiella sonneratiae]